MEERTAVTVSMHKTNDSEVRYLESEKEYSFHNCPNRSCLPGIFAWLKAKYPVGFLSFGTRRMICWFYPRRKDGWSQLTQQSISKLLFQCARGFVSACARTQNKPQYCCFVPRRQIRIMGPDQSEGNAQDDKPSSCEYGQQSRCGPLIG